MIELLDPHGVPSFHLRYLVEVWSVFGSGVPIFSPPSQLGKQLALVVEGELPIPVWVISPESIEEEPLRGPVGELVETLAYWLWQFRIDGAILGLILIGLSSIFWYGFFCSTRTPSWCGGNDSHRPYVVQLALIGNELLI